MERGAEQFGPVLVGSASGGMNIEGQRYAIIGAGDLAFEVICYLAIFVVKV